MAVELPLRRITPAFDGAPPGKIHFIDPWRMTHGAVALNPVRTRRFTLCGYQINIWWKDPVDVTWKGSGVEPELCRPCRAIAEQNGWYNEILERVDRRIHSDRRRSNACARYAHGGCTYLVQRPSPADDFLCECECHDPKVQEKEGVTVRVKLRKVSREGTTYRRLEFTSILMKETAEVDGLPIGAYFTLTPEVSGQVSVQGSEELVRMASLDTLLDEIKRRARGSV